MKIFKIGQSTWSIVISSAFGRKSWVNFGTVTFEIQRWNHTYPNLLTVKNIFRPLHPKFLRTLQNDQVLLVHPPLEMGVFFTIFTMGIKNGLKFSFGILVARNLELGGVVSWNFCMACLEVGVIMWVQLLWGTAPLKFRRAKSVQNLVWLPATFELYREYLWNR